ncbi:MAG TPA: rRNA maturation RNase YbeY [Spirochaetota bacterium]|nr:MAG: Endoribonuclease YbeY [Spirochaetes bacterium ADurb.BinA120]HNU90409.1 rRNA maturation RNase YbeY [Spirochaetota bacterium]HPI14453.1 rRNA maturation RNase YbeY [Spirochaetota bacterium]HPV96245.1 rRNA maturation RNase YbeY [Spirochaetota bacterium]
MRKRSRTEKTSVSLFLEGRAKLPFDGISGRRVKSSAGLICLMAGITDAAISIILTDDEGIRRINSEYRKKNRPTDVISFAYRENPFPAARGAPEEVGDVYISLERAAEQAVRFGATPAGELMRLLVHGILHLAGYDHERTKEEAEAMRARESEILSAVTRRLPSRRDRF